MGQCLAHLRTGGARADGRAVLSYIPLYDATRPDRAAEAPARDELDDPQQRALARLKESQTRLARRQTHLVAQEQDARRAAVRAWAERPATETADPAAWTACRRRARHELYRAGQFRASTEALSGIERQLVQLKVQLSTLRVTADALSVMNEYSSHVAAELRQLRETVDVHALVATIQRNADELADVQDTLATPLAPDDPEADARLEAELDLLEQEFARTSLRQTVTTAAARPTLLSQT